MIERLKVIPAMGWLAISVAFFTAGEYLSKRWGYRPTPVWGVSALVSYVLGSMAWLAILLHHNELVRMGTLWSLLTQLATVLTGFVVFHEKLTQTQWVGFALALCAFYLLKGQS